MKNKKAVGIFPEEVMKVMIAIIVLVLLFYLAFSLYSAITQKSKLEQARVHMENIDSIINNLNEGESKNYLLTSPKDWFLVYFEKGTYSGASDVPRKCADKNCLCMCTYRIVNGGDSGNFRLPDCSDSKGENICYFYDEGQLVRTSSLSLGIEINISEIYLSKTDGNVVIERREGNFVNNKNLFSEMMSFKSDQNSQSVDELISIIINQGGNNFESKLEESLELFTENKDIYIDFSITDLSVSSISPGNVFMYYSDPDISFYIYDSYSEIIKGDDGRDYRISFISKARS